MLTRAFCRWSYTKPYRFPTAVAKNPIPVEGQRVLRNELVQADKVGMLLIVPRSSVQTSAARRKAHHGPPKPFHGFSAGNDRACRLPKTGRVTRILGRVAIAGFVSVVKPSVVRSLMENPLLYVGRSIFSGDCMAITMMGPSEGRLRQENLCYGFCDSRA
jgi:hypothetical protein